MKRMVIVADNSFFAETIWPALHGSAGFKLVGKVDGRAPVGAVVGPARPDVVLIDETQNGDLALQRIRECRAQAPAATILLLSTRMQSGRVARALMAGADACVSKSAHLPSLGALIREIANGTVVSALPPTLEEGSLTLPGHEELSAREREILELAAQGLTNARIGKQLWITEQTVKFHLSNVYRKLGVSNRTEASSWVHAHGLTRGSRPRLEPAPDRADPLAQVRELTPLPTANVA